MEAQVEHPQRSVIGEEEHHEKKSMMKKMKDKAVKIKDTLKKYGHVFESTTAHTLEGQRGHPGRSSVHLDNPPPHQEDSNKSDASEASPTNYQAKTADPSFIGGSEAHVSPVTHSFKEMKVSKELEKTTAQTLEGQGGHLGRSEVHSGNPQPLQEDPNQPGVGVALLANYQAKTTDPSSTGEAEAHVSPHSFQEMKVYEEPEKTEDSPRGSHDQFSPTTPPSEPTPTQVKPEPSAASTVSEVVTGKTAQGPEEKGVSDKVRSTMKTRRGGGFRSLATDASERARGLGLLRILRSLENRMTNKE
ncbi:hypothetical protein QJS04_geneDACA001946 [Acorus gramineus]|uniref:Uncharacterized protein n=1 Tax=Acorus gramineus TaxID=55184 RepID=A0AAV9A981_ACOGR|nr:hypothetical protein QJS04_geneDACA001946 [Acorus gramineus]